MQRAGGYSRGSGASRGILQDSLNSLGNRYQRSQEGEKRAVCLKSKGRGAMGMENWCEGRIESWEEKEGGAWLTVHVRVLEGGCAPVSWCFK